MRKNIKFSLVNLTLNMRYKNDKKIQICHHQIRFFKLKMHQNPLDPAGGAYDAPPDPLVGWGGGYPSPFPSPLDAEVERASVLRSPPLNTKYWLRQ